MVVYCSDCDAEREFERPPCLDNHEADCPEYACVDCGSAILLGTLALEGEARTEVRYVA